MDVQAGLGLYTCTLSSSLFEMLLCYFFFFLSQDLVARNLCDSYWMNISLNNIIHSLTYICKSLASMTAVMLENNLFLKLLNGFQRNNMGVLFEWPSTKFIFISYIVITFCLLSIIPYFQGGGREWQWCRVSYVTGASN